MKNNLSVIYAFMLVLGDFLALLTAFILAYIFRVSLDPRPLVNQISALDYLQVWFLLTPVWLVIFGLLGLYTKRIYDYRWRELVALLIGSTLGTMVVITYDFASSASIFPARLIPVYALVLGFLLLILERTLLRAARMTMWRYGKGINNVLIIGSGPTVASLIKSINRPAKTGYKIVGVVSKEVPDKYRGKHFITADEAFTKLASLNVQTVLYTGVSNDNKAVDQALAIAQAHHLAFKFVPAHDGILSNNIEVELFQGLPVVSVHQTALTGWGRIAKRLFDIGTSLFGILILSPVFIIIGLVVWLSDFGPPIFVQKRLSRFNTTINIYKFRSNKRAYNGLLPEEAFTKMGKPELAIKYRANGDYLKKDPRVTKVGHFLRRTSLDELPQLFNVLKGDISLVGPRALVPRELENYPFKNLLLSVKSGVTGLAQISGRRDISFEERRALDLYYVQNWSFWLDIKIIFRTVIDVLGGRGAK
jgi:exopolysaccharide biosynthesis polyprenyl glycosylphosphotransferase